MPDPAAFWNKLAESYAAKPVENPDAFERKIAITQAELTPESVVLDIGCGTGSLALRLAPDAAHVHGLDCSSEMIRIARGKMRDQGTSNVTFHTGPFDAHFTQLEDRSLDCVCAYSILHLIPDRATALAHIHRLLKPGGVFVSSTVCLGTSGVPYRPILAVMRWIGKAPWVAIISRETVAQEMRDAGFVDVEQPDVGAGSTICFVVARKPL